MKTPIATNPSQSARLQACGLDPKTADFVWMDDNPPRLTLRTEIIEDGNPYILSFAWSLSKLLALLPIELMWQGLYYRLVMGPDVKGWEIEYNDLSVTENAHRTTADTLIEAVVQIIERLTSNGCNLNEIKQ